MYYNGCFFTKNPSQALSGKMGSASQRANRRNCNHAMSTPISTGVPVIFQHQKTIIFQHQDSVIFQDQKQGGPEKPKAKRQQTNRITVMIGCWHLLSSPCRQLIRMRDHEGMRLQHLRRFFSSADKVYASGPTFYETRRQCGPKESREETRR